MNENSQCISKSECIELGEPAVREKVQQGQRKSHSAEAVLLNSFFFCDFESRPFSIFVQRLFFDNACEISPRLSVKWLTEIWRSS